MTPQQEEAARQAFEAWARRKGYLSDTTIGGKPTLAIHPMLGFMREAWLASSTALSARLEEVERERDRCARENSALLSSAAAQGDEPDLLLVEWRNETSRAEQAEEAFGICRDKLQAAEARIRELTAENEELHRQVNLGTAGNVGEIIEDEPPRPPRPKLRLVETSSPSEADNAE